MFVPGLPKPMVLPPSASTRTAIVPGKPLIALLHAGALNVATRLEAVLRKGSIWNSQTFPRVATDVTAGRALLLVRI